MKKLFFTFILTFIAIFSCIFGLTACNKVEFKVNFVVEGEVYATIDTNGQEIIRMPENPTKEGFTFDGWFWDKDVWEKPFTANSLLDAPLSSDMSVYAKFSLIHNCDFKEKVASDIYKATGATCENKATYYFSCSCGEKGTQTFESGEALGHNFTNYLSDNNATCEVDGTKTAVCNRNGCNETDTIIDVNSKLGHNFTNYISDNNANCEVDGTKTAVCNRNGCNETDTITDVNSKLGHSFTNYISDNNATYDADGTKTAVCNRNGCNETDTITDNGSKLQSYFGFNLGYTINNRKAYIKVCSTTKTIYFPDEIVLKGNATYKVYKDIGCENELKGKELVLENVGENKCYILATVNGEDTLYHVTIYLRTKYTVNFITNNNTTIESQVIEEDSLAQKPNDLVKAGYTFNGYDFDFNTPITKNETVTALWTANDNTPYTVEYYLENLENEEYTLTQTNNLTGVTDTTAYAEIKTFEYFTAEKQTVSGNINGNGTTVLKVYYQRNEYTVSNADKSLGSITGAGKYKYGKQITLQSSPILGYNVNWYRGEELLSDSLCYTVTIDKDIIAKFAIKPEMANFNFTSTATTCVISGVKNKTITEIIVPNYVTSIGEDAFDGCYKLVEVINKSSNITVVKGSTDNGYVGYYALSVSNCDDSYVSKVSTDSNGYVIYIDGEDKILVNYVGEQTELVLPSDITKINKYAFYNTDNITSVTIDNSVTSIGDRAFYDCDSLTSIEIPNSVTSIGSSAFYNCSELTSITIGTGVSSIGSSAFYNCSKLTSVNIPNSVTSIGYMAFAYCSSLTSVTIGNSVTSIGDSAFAYCKSLTSVTIGNSVTKIGWYAFEYCSSLTSIEIPDSVTSIGSSAFSRCSKLKSITLPFVGATKEGTSSTYFGYIFGASSYSYNYDYVPTSLKTVILTDSVTSIGDYAFSGCSSLTSIEIPDSVTSIGYAAFYNCSSLTSIEIPNSVTSIGSNAFYNCSSLTSIVIPDSVTSIGGRAFYNCSKLTSVNIPNSVTSIGERAFEYCSLLTIYCEATSKPSNWSDYWNLLSYAYKYYYLPVVWGYKG